MAIDKSPQKNASSYTQTKDKCAILLFIAVCFIYVCACIYRCFLCAFVIITLVFVNSRFEVYTIRYCISLHVRLGLWERQLQGWDTCSAHEHYSTMKSSSQNRDKEISPVPVGMITFDKSCWPPPSTAVIGTSQSVVHVCTPIDDTKQSFQSQYIEICIIGQKTVMQHSVSAPLWACSHALCSVQVQHAKSACS